MEIKINVEKKYVWILGLLIVAVGLVVAYGGTNPPVMGHSFGELQGVAPNCEVAANDPVCAGPKSSGWNLGGVSAWAGIAWNSERLGGKNLAQVIQDNTKVKIIECGGKNKCAERGTPNEICKGYGASWKAIAVDCECIEVAGGTNQDWDTNMDETLDWCCDTAGEDLTVTCRSP